jgi:DMSO reductase anchor subunit
MLGRDAFRRFVSTIYMGGCVMCVVVVLRNTVRLFHQELFLSRPRRRLSEERPTSWARASYNSTVSGVKCNYCCSIYTKRGYETVHLNVQTSLRLIHLYNFAPAALLFSFSLSLKNLLRIFPLGLFGITSMNSTPPVIHLYLALCSSTCF